MYSSKIDDASKAIKKANVLYEGDIKAVRRKFVPSNIVAFIVYAICTFAIVFGAYQLYSYLSEVFGAQDDYNNIVNEYVQEPEEIRDDPEFDSSLYPPIIDFSSLKKENNDVAGWIRIPGTTVDYPIMTSNEQDYYLHRDIHKKYSYPGSIFADRQNTNDLSQDHIVLYGHHMLPPTMFHDVARYNDGDGFLESHRTVYLETPDKTYELEVIGTYVADPTDSSARKVLFDDEMDFQSYLDEKTGKCADLYKKWDRKTADKLVSLVTCNNTGKAREIVECSVKKEYQTSMIPNIIEQAKKKFDNEHGKE